MTGAYKALLMANGCAQLAVGRWQELVVLPETKPPQYAFLAVSRWQAPVVLRAAEPRNRWRVLLDREKLVRLSTHSGQKRRDITAKREDIERLDNIPDRA